MLKETESKNTIGFVVVIFIVGGILIGGDPGLPIATPMGLVVMRDNDLNNHLLLHEKRGQMAFFIHFLVINSLMCCSSFMAIQFVHLLKGLAGKTSAANRKSTVRHYHNTAVLKLITEVFIQLCNVYG